MINCVIVEDEISGQTILKRKLERYFPECNILKIIDNKDEAVQYINEHIEKIHLAFLDVEIKGGFGTDVLKEIDSNKLETIFVTAYKRYAIDALNSGASFYLLKPLNDENFMKIIRQTIEIIEYKFLSNTLLVSHNNIQVSIQYKDIVNIQSEGAYSYIFTLDKKFMTSKNIGHYEEVLPPSMFIRTHNSHIVNIRYIVSLARGRNGMLTMTNKMEIPISQRKMQDFKDKFEIL